MLELYNNFIKHLGLCSELAGFYILGNAAYMTCYILPITISIRIRLLYVKVTDKHIAIRKAGSKIVTSHCKLIIYTIYSTLKRH